MPTRCQLREALSFSGVDPVMDLILAGSVSKTGDLEGSLEFYVFATFIMKCRCEDICWIRTNNKNSGTGILDPRAVLTRLQFCVYTWNILYIISLSRTKEHCLMGIKGTVRRSTDGDFIHANVDIDLIIDEEPVVSDFQYFIFS